MFQKQYDVVGTKNKVTWMAKTE